MFFPCTHEGCDKLFNCKKALKEHERTHNQDRPFKCDLCDQTFTQYSSLQKHARVHDKKKPYTCENPGCDQAFSQVSNLIRHQRIHTGEKPYVCEICNKQFASGSNLKQHLQIHDKQDVRNQFKCIFENCEKKYLYPSSLKKHYMVSHREQYELYLQDQKIETCGFHLKEGDDIDGDDNASMFDEEEEQQELEMIRAKPERQVLQAKGGGSTFSSLANAHQLMAEPAIDTQAAPRNHNKRLYSQTLSSTQQPEIHQFAKQEGILQLQKSVHPEQQQRHDPQQDIIERMLPRKRPLLGAGANSNFSSAGSNMGSNSLFGNPFGVFTKPASVDHRQLLMSSDANRGADFHQPQNIPLDALGHNSDSFAGGMNHHFNIMNYQRAMQGGNPSNNPYSIMKQDNPLSIVQQLLNYPQARGNQSIFQQLRPQEPQLFKNPEPPAELTPVPQTQAQINASNTLYLKVIQDCLNQIQQSTQNAQPPPKASKQENDFVAPQVTHEIPGFKLQPLSGEQRRQSNEEEKRPSRIAGLSRAASAALEVASTHSLGSILSPSVCIRQPPGDLAANKQENHGSLGLLSDIHHSSALSIMNSRAYPYRSATIKQHHPKVLMQYGKTVNPRVPPLPEISVLGRAHSSDHQPLKKMTDIPIQQHQAPAERQSRSKSLEEGDPEAKIQDGEQLKVEESIFKSNISLEIEDINKRLAETTACNSSPGQNLTQQSAFSLVRHLFPSGESKQAGQSQLNHQVSGRQQSSMTSRKSQFFKPLLASGGELKEAVQDSERPKSA